MPVRVSATDRIRTKIDALFAEDRDLSETLEEVARLGAQLLMQAALEAEVTECSPPRCMVVGRILTMENEVVAEERGKTQVPRGRGWGTHGLGEGRWKRESVPSPAAGG